jgi:hypothetical protein
MRASPEEKATVNRSILEHDRKSSLPELNATTTTTTTNSVLRTSCNTIAKIGDENSDLARIVGADENGDDKNSSLVSSNSHLPGDSSGIICLFFSLFFILFL